MIDAVQKQIEAKYACRAVRLTGGYTNVTYLLEGTNPLKVAKVVKRGNEDAANEIACLHFLQASLATPVLHEVWELEAFTIVIMDCRQGRNGQSVLDAGERGNPVALYEQMGRFLAVHIHSHLFLDHQTGIRKSNANLLQASIQDAGFVPEKLVKQSQEILDAASIQEDKWVLTHGDYGPHNVLLEAPQRLTVLDWEWAEWGSPVNDIAWVCWFAKLHYPDLAPALLAAFLQGYRAQHPVALSPEQLHWGSVYRVWNVMNRVRHASKDVQEEWTRRLEWTLQIDFSDIR